MTYYVSDEAETWRLRRCAAEVPLGPKKGYPSIYISMGDHLFGEEFGEVTSPTNLVRALRFII